jgi:GAF domain-containing protein
VKRKTIFRYTFFGILFGLLFPIISIIWNFYHLHLAVSWESFIKIQINNPMQWMIDMAPFFLGLFALLAGIRRAKLEILNQDLEKHLREKNRLVEELELSKSGLAKEIDDRILMLEAIAHVAREAAGIRDLDELLARASQLISEYLGFYHVGIFLLEKDGDYASLRASNREGGARMLERGRRLKTAQMGIAGQVAETGQPRIALDLGDDKTYFNNPDHPDTRSEMALPLKVRKRLIGVLDVQSTEPEAFNSEDLETLQILADQIALSIDNARLLEESKQSLKELEFLYAEQMQRAWRDQRESQPLGYRYAKFKLTPISLKDFPENGGEEEGYIHRIPLKLRHQTIGYIQLRREPDQRPWSRREIQSIEKISNQIALSLENARLFAEARGVVQREQKINAITNQIRNSIDLETVLQNTVRELGKALDSSKTFIQIGLETANGPEEVTS